MNAHTKHIEGLSSHALRCIARDLGKNRRRLNRSNPVHEWQLDRLHAVEAKLKLEGKEAS